MINIRKPGPFHAKDGILGIQGRCSPLAFAILPRHATLTGSPLPSEPVPSSLPKAGTKQTTAC